MAAHGAQSLEAEVEKAFIDNEVVPDVLSVAPKKALDVGFSILFSGEFSYRFVYSITSFTRSHIRMV